VGRASKSTEAAESLSAFDKFKKLLPTENWSCATVVAEDGMLEARLFTLEVSRLPFPLLLLLVLLLLLFSTEVLVPKAAVVLLLNWKLLRFGEVTGAGIRSKLDRSEAIFC